MLCFVQCPQGRWFYVVPSNPLQKYLELGVHQLLGSCNVLTVRLLLLRLAPTNQSVEKLHNRYEAWYGV
jgi:hypothetical protein